MIRDDIVLEIEVGLYMYHYLRSPKNFLMCLLIFLSFPLHFLLNFSLDWDAYTVAPSTATGTDSTSVDKQLPNIEDSNFVVGRAI